MGCFLAQAVKRMADPKDLENALAQAEEAPDPDENDLDDLDEMLDEFSSTKLSSGNEAQKDSKDKAIEQDANEEPTKPLDRDDGASALPPGIEDSEFAKQLQAGMAEMMRELESNPDMAKQFEDMMSGQIGSQEASGFNGANSTEDVHSNDSAQRSSVSADTSTIPGQSFQDSIRKTMDRMRESNESASAANAGSGNPSEEDFMTQMINEIAQAGGGDGNSEESFNNMLLGMMEQLTNKDILYEPMKELDTKFPAWLAEREPGQPKAETISDTDRTKYKEQHELVQAIVERFEKPTYSDDKPEDRKFIVEKMQKMQAAGAPPSDLVGDMGAASEMLEGMDSQCPQQ